MDMSAEEENDEEECFSMNKIEFKMEIIIAFFEIFFSINNIIINKRRT